MQHKGHEHQGRGVSSEPKAIAGLPFTYSLRLTAYY